jgi:ribosomal protein S18 acetylase RimI-like enzyme
MIEVLKVGPKDYKLVHGLAQKVWPQTYKNILSPEQIDYMFSLMYSNEAYLDQINVQGHHFLVVKEGGEYLGFASYELNYHYQTTKIHKIYVLPQTQGKGIGRVLLTAIENIAARNDNTIVSLNVNRYNPAIGFYEKVGFEKAGEEDINIGNGYLMEDYIMEKKI